MYLSGWGVKQDYTEAAKWYRKAAEQGNASAHNNLGVMYYNGGSIVKHNYKTAYMCYFLASLSGFFPANDILRKLEEKGWFSSAKVSPSEAREAQAQAQRKYDEIRKRYGLD